MFGLRKTDAEKSSSGGGPNRNRSEQSRQESQNRAFRAATEPCEVSFWPLADESDTDSRRQLSIP
jgi:hypothetical protein